MSSDDDALVDVVEDDGDDGGPRLPPEILSRIVHLSAASEPAPSRHHLELALTSRAVHAFSERGRWQSIALKTLPSFLTFCDLLGADPNILRTQARIANLNQKNTSGLRWRGDSTQARRWCPSPKQLCAYLVNFLAEVDMPQEISQQADELDQRAQLSIRHLQQELWVGVLHRLTHWSPDLQMMSLNAVAISGLAEVTSRAKRKERALHRLFPQCPPVIPTAPKWPHPAAVSQYELIADPVLGPFGPLELTIEWHGDDWTLRTILFADCWCPPPAPEALAAEERGNIQISSPPVFVGLSSRLQRLHLVGVDPSNAYDGHVIPVELLAASVLAGSLSSTNHLVRTREVASKIWRGMVRKKELMELYLAEHPGMPMSDEAYILRPPAESKYESYEIPDLPDTIPVVTHLRYDTVKFTFRPFEALAQRLRPFFEHLHVVGAPYPPRPAPALNPIRAGRPRARHPRHDAAVRSTLLDGSNYIPLDEVSSPNKAAKDRTKSDNARAVEAAEYHLRTALGAGAFARLHLAWDPPPVTPAEPIAQLAKEVKSLSVKASAVDDSGWPTERRDVWTNHSSSSSSSITARERSRNSKGPAPRQGSARLGLSDASSPFTMELAEAIEHRIQFPFTQQLFEARAHGTYPAKALLQRRTEEQIQVLNAHDPLWLSEEQRCVTYLSRVLGQELVLRGCSPAQLAAAAIHRSTTMDTEVVGVKRAIKTPAHLPPGTLIDRESILIEPSFMPELELVPISPYAPSPDGPAPPSSTSSDPSDASSASSGPLSQFRRPLLPHRAAGTKASPKAEPILKLGGAYAAFTPEERVRLFLERIQGGAGSWV
ncbi:hypothetical protein V8E36_003304 [Tilletia maclaganii]